MKLTIILLPRELAWWLHPIAIFVGLNGLTGVAAFLADPKIYIELWRTPKYFTEFHGVGHGGGNHCVLSGRACWATRNQSRTTSGELEWRGTVLIFSSLGAFQTQFLALHDGLRGLGCLGVSRGLSIGVLKSDFHRRG